MDTAYGYLSPWKHLDEPDFQRRQPSAYDLKLEAEWKAVNSGQVLWEDDLGYGEKSQLVKLEFFDAYYKPTEPLDQQRYCKICGTPIVKPKNAAFCSTTCRARDAAGRTTSRQKAEAEWLAIGGRFCLACKGPIDLGQSPLKTNCSARCAGEQKRWRNVRRFALIRANKSGQFTRTFCLICDRETKGAQTCCEKCDLTLQYRKGAAK